MQLRPYQNKCIETMWANMFSPHPQLIKMPTGSGKTVTFVKLLGKSLEKYSNLKAIVLVRKVILVEQTETTFKKALKDVKVGLSCGSLNKYEKDHAITIASLQTVHSKPQFANVLIVDEAHSYTKSKQFEKYISALKEINPKIKIIGCTATDFDSDGYIHGEGRFYPKLNFEMSLNEMIDMGYLVPIKFRPTKHSFDTSSLKMRGGDYVIEEVNKLTRDQRKVSEQVSDALSRVRERKKIVWSCVSIKHALMVQSEILKYEDCAIIHSQQTKKERKENIEKFERGECRHFVSITIVSEGYDFPPIDCVVIMRPTRSANLFVQLVGRGLRLSEGKKDCLILDYGEVLDNLGHPDSPYIRQKGDRRTDEKRIILCPVCEDVNFLPVVKCGCGYVFFKQEAAKRDLLKNTTEKAAEDFGAVYEFNVLNWWKKEYISKAGNDCWKVEYVTTQGVITEFIKKETWFEKKFLEDEENGIIKIECTKEGKYWRVNERRSY